MAILFLTNRRMTNVKRPQDSRSGSFVRKYVHAHRSVVRRRCRKAAKLRGQRKSAFTMAVIEMKSCEVALCTCLELRLAIVEATLVAPVRTSSTHDASKDIVE